MPERLEREEVDCSLGGRSVRREVVPSACLPRGATTWLVLGDSHARSLARGRRLAAPEHVAIAMLTGSGCPPFSMERRVCARTSRYAATLVTQLKPAVVLLVQQGGHDERDWRDRTRDLRLLGAQEVIVVGPVPQWERSLPQIIARRYWPKIPSILNSDLDETILSADAQLNETGNRHSGFKYISIIDDLCSSAGCLAAVPGTKPTAILHMDYGHLSPEGAHYVARQVVVPEVSKLIASGPN